MQWVTYLGNNKGTSMPPFTSTHILKCTLCIRHGAMHWSNGWRGKQSYACPQGLQRGLSDVKRWMAMEWSEVIRELQALMSRRRLVGKAIVLVGFSVGCSKNYLRIFWAEKELIRTTFGSSLNCLEGGKPRLARQAEVHGSSISQIRSCPGVSVLRVPWLSLWSISAPSWTSTRLALGAARDPLWTRILWHVSLRKCRPPAFSLVAKKAGKVNLARLQ